MERDGGFEEQPAQKEVSTDKLTGSNAKVSGIC
jgi:hypothetical protein